jgi:hypothetical protein
MKKLNKNWSIIVYILVLVIITMFLWVIVFDSNISLTSERKVENIDNILMNNILYNGKLAIKYDKKLNSNWSWFIDNLSCPNNVYMSWDTWREINSPNELVSPTKHTQTWAYCSWTYTQTKYGPTCWIPIMPCTKTYWSSRPFTIKFNNDYTNFSWASYFWEDVTLANTYEAQFHDSDNTKMTFTNSPWSDLIDDNFNSDNYNVNSTWSAATWVVYPLNSNWRVFEDDDVKARKIAYSYITPEAWYVNVFWSNTKMSNFIDKNINNDDNINIKIWEVGSWTLYFDIDEAVDFRIVEFDKNRFDTTKELIATQVYEKSFTWGIIWYLQLNSWQISFSDIHTSNDFIFDFKTKDYAVFLKNKSILKSTILCRISWEDKSSWKGIYLVPLDDSDNIIIKYLWWNIIKIDSDYIYKIEEVYWEK